MILLPGLYLALLAFLLDRALRRWWEPVPARIWGVFALLLVVLFGPALFLGKVLLPGDILPGVVQPEDARKPPQGNLLQFDLVTQIVPLQAQVRREIRSGEWPLWNDLAGAGMPLLANPQSQTFEPLVLLALPFPLHAAVGITAGLRVLIALVFFFLLLRRQGLSEGSALFGSLAFGLGGFLLLWLNWPIGNTPALMPLVLYALVVTDERGARRDYLLLVAALFSLLVGGHPETILYVAIVGSLFALSRLLRRPSRERPARLARWILAAAIAAGLAAPGLVPAFRLIPQSLRHHWVEVRNERMDERPMAAGIRDARPGLGKRIVLVFAPNAFGNSRYGHYWGDANSNEDASAFVGGAAILAALLAFLPARRRFREERIFLALAPLSLLIAVRIPGVPLLLSNLPVLNQSISSNRRMLLLVAFSFAWLGACTVERWRTGEGPRRGAVLLGGAILLGAIAWGYLLSAHLPALAALRWFWVGTQMAAVAGAAGLMAFGRGGEGRDGRPLRPGRGRAARHPPPGEPVAAAERLLSGDAAGPLPPGERGGLADRGAGEPDAAQRQPGLRSGGHPDLGPLEALLLRAGGRPGQRLDPLDRAHPDEAGAPDLPASRGALGGGAAADELDSRPAGGLPRSHRTGVRAGEGAPPALPPRVRRECGGKAMARLARREPRLRGPRAPVLHGRLDGGPARQIQPWRSSPPTPPASKPAPASPRSASSPPASIRTAAGASCSTAGFTPPRWRTAPSSRPGCRPASTGWIWSTGRRDSWPGWDWRRWRWRGW